MELKGKTIEEITKLLEEEISKNQKLQYENDKLKTLLTEKEGTSLAQMTVIELSKFRNLQIENKKLQNELKKTQSELKLYTSITVGPNKDINIAMTKAKQIVFKAKNESEILIKSYEDKIKTLTNRIEELEKEKNSGVLPKRESQLQSIDHNNNPIIRQQTNQVKLKYYLK